MTNEFNEAVEREKLTEAEIKILEMTRKKQLSIFFINDKLYVFDQKTNRKIMGTTPEAGYNMIIGQIQSGNTESREVLPQADKRRIKEALHCYLPRYVNFTYSPSKERVIEDNGLSYYNVFQPSFYEDRPLEPPYCFPTIDEFLNKFFASETEKKWFIERLAYTIQNPEDRLPTALLLMGVQGSGKDTLKTIIERTIGNQNIFSLDQASIENSFNAFIGKSQVVFCNEIHNWKDPTRIYNILKNYMTNKKIMVNEKYTQPYTASNYAFWILATNDPKFSPVDENDRRYSVSFQSKKLIDNLDKETYERLIDLIVNPEHENEIYSEFHNFYWYLKCLEVEDKEFIRNPLQTRYREQMIKAKLGNNVDYGIISKIIKDICDDKGTLFSIIMKHADKYYIKPKILIDRIIQEKQSLNLYRERKFKMQYDNVKQELIGSLWFKDHTDLPVRIEGRSQRVLQIVEKRLIDIIEGRSTENMDEKDDPE